MQSMSANVPLKDLVTGYPKLAGQMETVPEIAIFRRFAALNARNLLYYQSELVALEGRLVEQESKDNNHGATRERYALDWFWLYHSTGEDGGNEQLRLICRMRELLREYNEALLRQAAIHNLPLPDEWDIRDIQGFLETKAMGPLALIGKDATVWGSTADAKSHAVDLVALRERPKEDALSTWLAEHALGCLIRCGGKKWKKPSRVHGLVGYQDSTVFRITLWITTFLASLIPLSSIAVLYCVHSMRGRFAVIGGFNLLITLCLSTCTTAKRSDIFAISAAFTAVQVVFINTGVKT